MSLKYKQAGLDDDDSEAAARFTEIDFTKTKSLTSQAPTDEVDINKIMARVEKGQTVLSSSGQPFYGDVSDLGGLQDALIKVQDAEDLFMQYPANVREKFNNDPVAMVEFLFDEKNRPEAEALGLVNKRPVPEPTPTPTPAPAPGSGSTQLPS